MKDGRGFQNILMFSGMIGLLIMAGVFDLITRVLVERNSQMGGLDVALVWLVSLFQLIWFLVLIGLVWLISSGGYSRWMSLLFLFVGLTMLFFSAILYMIEFPDIIYFVVPYLSPGMMLFQASGAIAAVGLISLWFWHPANRAETNELSEAEKVAQSAE